jgi:tetratricopeptide (TPR) repeat protein
MGPGRNDPCPCHSGKKFKHCCGRPEAVAPATSQVAAPDIAVLMSMLNQGWLAQAEERVGALLRAHPSDGMLWKIYSVVLLRQDKDAMAALRRAVELLPRDAEAHANLGAELRTRGQWQDALTSLRHSLSLQPRNPDALIDAADVQRSLGRSREAVTLYQQALQIDPSRRDAHNNLGNAFLELGESAEAAQCYRRALRLRPDDAQVLCNLGNALRQLGEFEEAITCSRRAIELAPQLSMAHNNLGLLMAARGERGAAINSYREALKHTPHYIEALSNLGNALRDDGQRHEALTVHQRAVELDPRRADSHCSLGYDLLDCRQVDEAANRFRRALSLQKDHVTGHLGLAIALRVQGSAAEAEASCQAALALAPQNPDALSLLGELLADRGKFVEAQALFERALAANQRFAPAYSSIAFHRHMTKDDVVWLHGAQTVLTQPLALAEETQLRYALGKYFDDVGDYDEAFSSYRDANELTKRCGGRYDGDRLTALIERIMERYDATFARVAPSLASNSEQPVFIIGMPRSGTSLAEQILASHPAVYGAGEVRFWDRAFATLEQAPRGENIEKSLGGLAEEYLQRVSARAGTALRITDKMPANFLYAGLIHCVFPRARIIHMQRHPLDTCLSVYFQNFFNVSPYANDLSDLAHYYSEYQRIMSHWRSALPHHTLLEVAYEDLVQDPEKWTRRMLDFVGLPWDPGCLNFHQTDRVVITASRWQIRQRITTSSMGRWRNYEKHLAPLRHLMSGDPIAAIAAKDET